MEAEIDRPLLYKHNEPRFILYKRCFELNKSGAFDNFFDGIYDLKFAMLENNYFKNRCSIENKPIRSSGYWFRNSFVINSEQLKRFFQKETKIFLSSLE